MTCLHTRVNGSGDLATCANPICAVFIVIDRDAADVWDRLRAEMTDAERTQEAEIRAWCAGGKPLHERDYEETSDATDS